MVAIPNKTDVVKLIKVSGLVPKGTMDMIDEQLAIKNAREGNDADLDFCLQYVLLSWAEEMKEENDRSEKKRKESRGDHRADIRPVVTAQSA